MNAKHGRPLEGLRIVDFTRVLAGPFCTALLADLGAEVIKIEPPQGDDYRHIGPMKNNESALFTVMNRSKKSLVLDLKNPQAVQLVHDLVAQSDVVIENFRPGVAARLGIDYDTLKAVRPDLVYVSVSGFGQTGPAASRPAYDIVIQAMSGLMQATGSPDGPPTLIGEAIADVLSGIFASWGAMVALYSREKTGRGSHVDVSMFESTLAFAATSVSRYLFTGRDPVRVGNRHPLSAPFGVYAASDGHYVLAVLNNRLFRQLADLIGQPGIADDPRFATDELRSDNEPALRALIEAWSGSLTVDEVVDALEQAAIPGAPIWHISQALSCDQVRHSGFLQDVDDERLPGLRLPSQPVKFSAYAGSRPGRAPRLGEHTQGIMQDLLGLGVEKIAELQALGVFGDTAAAATESSSEPLQGDKK